MGKKRPVIRSAASQEIHPEAKTTPAADTLPERTGSELSRVAATQAVFLNITRTFGIAFVPELFEEMSARPAYLETAWELFKEGLHFDQLDCKTKQIIALAITTDNTGVYYILAFPHAFRLNALDEATCDKIVSTIRFFKAFDRYLSGIMPADVTETTEFVSHCLRDEYQSYEATRSSEMMLSREENQPIVSLIGGILIMGFLLIPIVAGVYLFLR